MCEALSFCGQDIRHVADRSVIALSAHGKKDHALDAVIGDLSEGSPCLLSGIIERQDVLSGE